MKAVANSSVLIALSSIGQLFSNNALPVVY